MRYQPNPFFDFGVRTLVVLLLILALVCAVAWLVVLPVLGMISLLK